jgi:hypothetical protein
LIGVTSGAPSWKNIRTAYADSIDYGGVGTYVFGYYRGLGVTHNTGYAGSSIEPAGIWADTSGGTDDSQVGAGFAADVASSVGFTKGAAALSGTWLSMGRVNNTTASTYSRLTLFVRTV